ncbi:MAG: N-formylglutamate amidohydrolase [Ignavibacteriae bacterium]|nr:N-formylglutamate amidohydrolase [Ignavibacteriota bacterium]
MSLGLQSILPSQAPGQRLDVADSLVIVQRGDLPIIISAPHGGKITPPDVPERDGNGVSRFATARDGNTNRLAIRLDNYFQRKLGKKLFLVVAQIDRACVDLNRPAEGSYEVGPAKRYYNAYHNALRAACDEVRTIWGQGILIDLHGQSAANSTVFRGTGDGVSVTNLVTQHGRKALVGKNSICGQLEANDFDIEPECDSDDREDPRFSGGYIVQTYGSHQGTSIDAIQLEFGLALRSNENLEATATRLAAALATFARTFLPVDSVQVGR